MAKTLLQMINEVYVNLREDQITSLTNDAYDNLIINFLNLAKEIVEDAWEWQALRKTITWTSVASQSAYDLTNDTADALGSGSAGDADAASNLWLANRSKIYRDPRGSWLAYDTTTSGAKFRLIEVPYAYGIDQQMNANTSSKPQHAFMHAGTFDFINAPDSSTRTYSMVVLIPQDALSAAADTITVPWRPVVTLATAWAVNERGEELGNRPILPQSVLNTDWASQAEKDLAKAIANDMDQDTTELTMDAGQVPWSGGSTWQFEW